MEEVVPDDRPTLNVPRVGPRINRAWLPFAVFGFIRQWIEYGVASAIILAIAMVPFVFVLLRWERKGVASGWRLMALLFGTCAAAELASVPFAHSSNVGTATIGSRSTALGAGITLVAMTTACMVMVSRTSRREVRHSDGTLLDDLQH